MGRGILLGTIAFGIFVEKIKPNFFKETYLTRIARMNVVANLIIGTIAYIAYIYNSYYLTQIKISDVVVFFAVYCSIFLSLSYFFVKHLTMRGVALMQAWRK